MSLKKIFQYFSGYCQISIKGHRRERFINLAATRDIILWDIVQKDKDTILCKANLEDINKLRHIARISKCPFKIRTKKGLPFFLKAINNRKMLVGGLLFFVITLYLLSSFVWFIQITSNKPLKHIERDAVLNTAKKEGLKTGVLKKSLNLADLEKRIMQSFPEAAFISIEYKGTLVKIDIVEKQLSEDIATKNPSHVIARKDGIIEEILILSGESKIALGDTVQKGQILISGVVPDKSFNPQTGLDELTDLPPNLVKAKGIIKARVWYEEKLVVPLIEKGYTYTGKKAKAITVRVGENVFHLKGPKKDPFTLSDKKEKISNLNFWRKSQSPVEIIQFIYHEKKSVTKVEKQDVVVAQAKEKIIEKLTKQIPKDAEILDKKIELKEIGNDKIEVSFWVETKENIGQIQEFEAN